MSHAPVRVRACLWLVCTASVQRLEAERQAEQHRILTDHHAQRQAYEQARVQLELLTRELRTDDKREARRDQQLAFDFKEQVARERSEQEFESARTIQGKQMTLTRAGETRAKAEQTYLETEQARFEAERSLAEAQRECAGAAAHASPRAP